MLEAAEVKAIAKLARIQMEPAELPAMVEQLAGILALIEQMNAIDTTDVEPLAHPLELPARRRADVVTERDERTAYQTNAPETREGYFLVPRVIE